MEDERLKAICDKLTDAEITYLTNFLTAKIIIELGKQIQKQNGKHK